MKKLILILALLVGSCVPEPNKCYYVIYENGIEKVREEWHGFQKDSLIDVKIKSWYNHYEDYAERVQMTYEIYIECDK